MKNKFFFGLVIGMGLVVSNFVPNFANAGEMELCLSNEVYELAAANINTETDTFSEWHLNQVALLDTAGGLQCKDIEEFRDTVTKVITGIAFVSVPIVHYAPHLYVKLLVGGTIGGLQYLSLYIKDLPCEKTEKAMQQQLSEAVCIMAQNSSGVVECKAYNSNYVLPIQWENNLNFKNVCQKINNQEPI